MADTIVTNTFSPTPAMNVIITCGVSYESNLGQVEEVVLNISHDIIKEFEYTVTGTDPFFGFRSFGDSNIDFFISITCTSRVGSFIVGSELIKQIHKRFGEEGIEINYPVRKLISTENNDIPDNEILDQAITENRKINSKADSS